MQDGDFCLHAAEFTPDGTRRIDYHLTPRPPLLKGEGVWLGLENTKPLSKNYQKILVPRNESLKEIDV